MPKTNASAQNSKIAKAALKLAATKAWQQITLGAVAKAAALPSRHLESRFKSIHELAGLIAEEIDYQAFSQTGKLSGSPHDILFDLLMSRFDVLQKNRKAILNMAEAAHLDRALACQLVKATIDGTYRLIEKTKVDMPRPLFAATITASYGWGFFVWRRDASPDMAKTMAALDKALRFGSKAAELFSLKGK